MKTYKNKMSMKEVTANLTLLKIRDKDICKLTGLNYQVNSFPKVCKCCGVQYADRESYISSTFELGGEEDVLTPFPGEKGEMLEYRNCACASTMTMRKTF